MGVILAKISEWLLKNSIQKSLLGAGLGVMGYLGILTAIRTAFNTLINSVYTIPADLLGYLGYIGIDHCLSAYVGVSLFLLTINSNKLFIGKKS